ncbi:hypothetical protein [Bosea sp. RAC05]|uniref:hypothetical protein n=1 Tax=Bosea sp. RAC05 TaxID=1842539 RepID=UPI0008561451|nr:hypothetical protein [Bosea sp. RAC05]AOG03117.1 hypothetical protein BSY19_5154 [Bosea sp. RAC05]
MDEQEVEANGPLSEGKSAFNSDKGLESKLANLLHQSNGFHFYRGALLFFPSGTAMYGIPTIEEFNAAAWKASYGPEVSTALFFAVDTLGYPFGIANERIVQLDPETGEMNEIADDFLGFFEAVHRDPDTLIGAGLFQAWVEAGRMIGANERLAPNLPFITAKASAIDDFHAEDMLSRAAFNAYLFEQTSALPKDARVAIKVVP